MSKSVPNTNIKSRWVNVNVGGTIFTLKWSTIKRFKDTRLEKLYWASTNEELLTLCDEYDLKKREYFFDRHPKSFEIVWNLLKSGKFYFDHEFCTANVLNDLKYWGVFLQNMPFCCIYNLEKKKEGIDEEVDKVKHIMKNLIRTTNKNETESIINEYKSKMWDIMEHPETSILARIVAGVSIFFIVLSTINLVVSTVHSDEEFDHHKKNVITEIGNNTTPFKESIQVKIHDIIESSCIGWFTLEYFLRLIATANKLRFLIEFLNIIDIIAIAPFYFTLLITNVLKTHNYDESLESFTKIFQVFRVLRVLRVLKLARHSDGLQSLGYTLQQSYKELGLLVSFIVIGVYLFSSLVYFTEKDTNTELFASIPHAFWWSIISMTTVGYGDIYPKSPFGQIFASFCCVSGVLVIALPIPIIVSNFSEFYKDKLRIEKTLKRHEELEKAQQSGNFVILNSMAERTNTGLNTLVKDRDAKSLNIPEIPHRWNIENWKYMDYSSSSYGESSDE